MINGAVRKEVYDTIERYAFLEGFCTCRLNEYLCSPEPQNRRYVLLYMDVEGMSSLDPDVMQVMYIRFPVIIVPASMDDAETIGKYSHDLCEVALYPFSLQAFRRYMKLYIDDSILIDRMMCFGNLHVYRKQREVSLRGRTLEIRGYNYEILLSLLEHIGEVVTREEINRCLPERQRATLRNVDTHIKVIRREIGIKELIRCVRSIGYCIPADRFCEAMA